MLKHVIEAQVLDRVVASVDVLVRVREGGFDNKGGGVPGFGRGGVVGAGVSALGLDKGDLTVLCSYL